jgi:chromosome segregation protein
MHLEKIEISGFKSFADKTILRFDKPITAIVGPNGCGKSNIVDAFRWVLGEGSAKSLRSDKMTDVIFSGSSKRTPLNFAQISLTFTEIKKTLTFNYEELCVTRRIHRSGESEWYVNKKPVRLKDVYTLLWEAGIGKNAFYIFEQGKVDSLITSTPLERRCIFEEAAKIMHFKEKKKEALRKLEQVEDNLKRVLDIQSEVNKQIETLQKQAQEARLFSENKNRLEHLEKGLLITKWNLNQKKVLQERALCEQNAAGQKKVGLDLLKKEDEIKAIKNRHSLKTIETRQASEAFFEIKKAKEVLEIEYNAHQKLQGNCHQQYINLKNSLQTLHQKHLKEHRAFEENQKILKENELGATPLSAELQSLSVLLLNLEKKVDEESALRRKAQQKLMTVVSSSNELQAQYRNHTHLLHTQKEKLAKLIYDEKRDLQISEEKRSYKDKFTLSLEDSSKELETALAQIERAQKELEQVSEKLENLKESQKNLLKERSENKATLDLLQSLKTELEGYNQSSKKLLRFAQNKQHPLFEKIFKITDWFHPKKGYEAALSTILKPYLETLLVHKKEDLELLIEVSRKEKLKNFSCICLETLPEVNTPLDWAEENLLACHFLHLLKESSTKESSSYFHLSEEFFCDHLGVFHHISKEEQNHFLRQVELKEREKKHLELDQKYKQITEEIDLLQSQKKTLQNELDTSRQKKHQSELSRNKAQFALESAHRELLLIEEKIASVHPKKIELSHLIQQLEEKQKELIALSSEEEKKRENQESFFAQIDREFEANFNELKNKRSLKESLQEKISTYEKKAQSLRESIRVFESKSQNFETQLEEISQTIEQKEIELKTLTQRNPVFEKKQGDLTEKLKTAEEKYRLLEKTIEAIELQEKEEEKRLKASRECLEEHRKLELEIKTKISQIEAEIHLQTDEIVEKLDLDAKEIPHIEIDPEISLGKTEREIKKLRRDLEEQPEVNLKAISECEKQKSRFEFLQSQIIDLEESKRKFIEIITELDDTSRVKFKETFEKIRSRFKENFLLLFNGGEADLQLTAAQDVLEAGIEIIAQPPGKKMRSIQLLSGGEKCLCAIALLFALFETQSIPFCILDEIDAPLDDTNIERFTNVLKQFVKNNQFIIITHNKRTMAVADNLLGVSMQEKGVTKILPLTFNSNTATSEALAQ